MVAITATLSRSLMTTSAVHPTGFPAGAGRLKIGIAAGRDEELVVDASAHEKSPGPLLLVLGFLLLVTGRLE